MPPSLSSLPSYRSSALDAKLEYGFARTSDTALSKTSPNSVHSIPTGASLFPSRSPSQSPPYHEHHYHNPMNKTKIPWANYSWNPIAGCSHASEGCDNCYAEAISKRFHLPWGSPVFFPNRLDEPSRVLTPSRIFVCSMADIGHESVQPEWRSLISRAMQKAPHHTFIILTKRPGPWLRHIPPSAWVGVTIESQTHINRWNQLLAWSWPGAPVKFVSVEPMLGPVSFRTWFPDCQPDWVIAGPETGPHSRHCHDSWIENLSSESPCFFDKRHHHSRREFPTPT